MVELAAALALLFLSHLVPSSPGVRQACINKLGLSVFRIVYSIVSIGVVAWLITAYVDAADGPWLWDPPAWGRWAAVAGMPVAIWLIAARLMNRPGAVRAGIYRSIPAPGSLGLLLWASLHLLNVGHARAVLLFGVFAIISAVAAIKNTMTGPIDVAPAAGSGVPGWKPAVAAMVAWAVMLGLHPYLIGVHPLVFP